MTRALSIVVALLAIAFHGQYFVRGQPRFVSLVGPPALAMLVAAALFPEKIPTAAFPYVQAVNVLVFVFRCGAHIAEAARFDRDGERHDVLLVALRLSFLANAARAVGWYLCRGRYFWHVTRGIAAFHATLILLVSIVLARPDGMNTGPGVLTGLSFHGNIAAGISFAFMALASSRGNRLCLAEACATSTGFLSLDSGIPMWRPFFLPPRSTNSK